MDLCDGHYNNSSLLHIILQQFHQSEKSRNHSQTEDEVFLYVEMQTHTLHFTAQAMRAESGANFN